MTNSSIYHTPEGKQAILQLYDEQIAALPCHCDDIYINTTYGSTHLIETGNHEGKPLLLFHGGNTTTAYNLKECSFLLEDFHIYAVDTIGHPGKSAETSLSPKNEEYGKWVSEVITQLGYKKIACFGGSFGAGILVKAMCVAPEKVERAVLLVPSGIKNASSIKIMGMLMPIIMYWMTHKEEWFIKSLLPMALEEENITKDTIETARCSIDHAKLKKGMPSNAKTEQLRKYEGPVYVLAAEKDCMFPGRGVLKRSRKVFSSCKGHLLKDRGHMNQLTEEEKESIIRFLKMESWK